MLGNILTFLLDILFTLFGAALVLRAWMQMARVHPYHPLVRGIGQVTNWLVMPLRRVIPGFGGIDWSSVVAAWLTAAVYVLLLAALNGLAVLAALPAALGVAIFMVLRWALNLLVWITLTQVVLSWVNPQAPLMGMLQSLTGPLLNPIRRVVPTPGGIDFSPLVLLIVAQVGLMLVAGFSLQLFGM